MDARAEAPAATRPFAERPRAEIGPPLGPLPASLRHWALNAAYGALTVALTPYAITRVTLDHKTRARWRAFAQDLPERFSRRPMRRSGSPCVWVHGVSVGEVKAVARLVEAMETEVENLETVVTVSTDTARRVACARYPGRRIDFYPPDLSWIVNDALDAVRPDLVVLAESEFWPNFLTACRSRGIPVVLVNGRMSERSCRRFVGAGPIGRHVMGALTQVCVQLDVYADRFARVGIDPERIHVTGNMKFDNVPFPVEDLPQKALRRILSHDTGRPLVVAGSTHPGEERTLVRTQRRLAARGLPFRLLLAPRHPARADVVEADVRREGGRVTRRSTLTEDARLGDTEVLLLDTVGELETAYSLADAVFVGGTLVNHGGQNMMEPASLGRPVVMGPSFHNFRGEVDLLLDSKGVVVAEDAQGVEETLAAWLRAPEDAQALGQRAVAAIQASKGATEKTLEVLRPALRRVARRPRTEISTDSRPLTRRRREPPVERA